MSSSKFPQDYGSRLLISDDWQQVYDVGEYEAETGIRTDINKHWMQYSEHAAILTALQAENERLRSELLKYKEEKNNEK